MRSLILSTAIFLLTVLASAQTRTFNTGVTIKGALDASTATSTKPARIVVVDQSGACLVPGELVLNNVNGKLFLCSSGSLWQQVSGTGAGGAWGTITGTLSEQTDLQSALDAKQNSLGFTAENSANKGTAGGYAGLDGSALLPAVNLPTHNHTATQITSGRLAFARGGLDLATLASGSVVYGSALDTPGAATLASSLQISGGIMSVVQSALNLANIGGTLGASQIGQNGATLNQVWQWNGAAWVPATLAGGGTVTSVALSLPAELDVTGSPVTGAGTLTGTWAAATNNFVFAGPATGGAGTPAFRALVAADIPSLDASKVTTGTFGSGRIPDLSSVYQPLDSDLTAISGLSATGLVTRNGSGSATVRQVTGTSPVSVTDGNGLAGNPTIACPTCVTASSALTSGLVVIGQGGQATAAATGVSVAAGVVTATGFVGPVTGTATGNALVTRTLTAGAGLTGGGDLSADRSFAVAAADTSITVAADAISVGLRTAGGLSTSSGVGLITTCGENYLLKYTTAGGWACAADSTGGTPTFDAVAAGTNTTAAMVVGSGATLGYTGTGTIDANRVFGINLAALATGIAKVTTGTGAISIATAGDIPDLAAIYATLGATAAHTKPVTITGSTDAIQLKVVCNATQTSNPSCFTVYKSDGTTPILKANADGSVELGSGSGPQIWTNQVAPSTPSAGTTSLWADSTDKILKVLNDAAATSVTVVPASATSNQFVTALSSAGVLSKAQPTPANLGAGTLAAAMTVGSGGSVAPTSATVGTVSANQINGTSLASAATGLFFNTTTTGGLTIKPLVTTLASPGSDNNVPSEKAVRDAITAIGSPLFSAIATATNTSATMTCGTGCQIATSGSGVVNANQINGTALSGLATGILKNTTTTGVPSIAVGADLPTHASRHQNGGDDEIATATAGANAIPKAGAGGTLAAGWIPATLTSGTAITSAALTTPVVTTDIHAATAGGATVGSAALPFSSVYIGGAATNNIRLTGTSAAARVVTIPDIGTDTGATAVLAAPSTTTTQALFASATAGKGTYREIVAADLPAALANSVSVNGTTIPASKTLMATDTAVADAQIAAKHKTYTKSLSLFDPVAGDSGRIQMMFPTAVTITRVACATKTATSTVTLNLDERAAATPDTAGTAVLSADLVADTDQQTSCASGCDVNTITNGGIAARVPLALTIASVANTPTDLRCHVEYTID